MEDGYPEIKKAGCTTAATLASRAPAGSLAAHTERLAQVRVVAGTLLFLRVSGSCPERGQGVKPWDETERLAQVGALPP
jgi:hypothetical protein